MLNLLFKLKGDTFTTLAQKKMFTIAEVNSSFITVNIHSTGRDRIIFGKEFEDAWNLLQQNGQLTSQELFHSGSRNTAYVTTILAQLPDVTVSLSPIVLNYKSS